MVGGSGGADLGVPGAEQRLLIAEVHFDAPAPQLILEHFLHGHVGVSAEQKGGLAVEQARRILKGQTSDVSRQAGAGES
jgi:hypothetical protein